ncbi:substrate-binding domain-containing protein [Candidatus Bipolaricaulota bacterium]|nr:substrate-binding domain-containing protein [Candidatus Bipolaricaulota bacterium]
MNKKLKSSLLVVLLIGVALVGSFATVHSQDVIKDQYHIRVVVHGGIADPFWKVVEKGVKEAAANHDDLKVTYSGPSSYDFTEFISTLESSIAADPDALVVTLTQPPAMDDILRPAIKDGLPVIGINAPDLRSRDKRIPVLTYVGMDSHFIGVKAARESMKRIEGLERGLYVNHHPGARNIEARGNGWVETLEANGVEAGTLDIGVEPAQGAELVVNYLTRHPDTGVIFSGNTQRTEAIIKRLEDEGYDVGKDIKICQMDISPTILDYIRDGKIMFTLDQQQYMQGYLGVELAYLNAKLGLAPPPAPVSTGPSVITKADVSTLEKLADKDYR